MSRTAAILILILFSASMAQAKNRPDLAPAIGSRGLLDCSQAAVITCGEEVTGSNVGMPSNVESYSCSGWQESFGETVYELVLTGPAHSVVLATLADMSCDLDIFLLGSCNEGDCLAHGDEAAYAPDLPPGVYYIVVDGYGGECSFTLRVECIPLSRPCCPLASYGYDFDFGSSDHAFAARVREATRIAQEQAPDLIIDGEIQLATALGAEERRRYFPFSRLDEDANVLIFPDLQAGNVALQVLQKLGDSILVGPVLLGTRLPVHVVQHGSSTEDLVRLAVIGSVTAAASRPAQSS